MSSQSTAHIEADDYTACLVTWHRTGRAWNAASTPGSLVLKVHTSVLPHRPARRWLDVVPWHLGLLSPSTAASLPPSFHAYSCGFVQINWLHAVLKNQRGGYTPKAAEFLQSDLSLRSSVKLTPRELL